MGLGGVAIAILPSIICLKLTFSDGLGGVFTQVTAQFNRGSLIGLSRCLKANMNDAGVMIEYK